MSILRRMAHRFNFFILLGVTLFSLSTYIFFIKVIYGYINLIAGWDLYHSLLLIGTSIIVEGIAWITFGFFEDLHWQVRNGTLDNFIVKPLDTHFLIAVNRIDPEELSRFVIAFFVLWYAFRHIQHIFLADIIFYLLLLICAYTIIFSLMTFLVTFGFWFVEIYGLSMLGERIMQFIQYPTDIYTGVLKTIFSFIIPIAFIATVPAKVLSGWYSWKLVVQAVMLAGTVFYLSRKFFAFGLKHYSSASS